MGRHLMILLSAMVLFCIPVNGSAAPIWPFNVGDVREYRTWEPGFADYEYETQTIYGQVEIGGELYYAFCPLDTPFEEGDYARSTENALYSWNEGEYEEFIIDDSTPTATVTVPYGGPYTAYVNAYQEASDGVWNFNFIVPGIGFVKATEYSSTGQLLYSTELVSWQTSAVPVPAAALLLGSGLTGLAVLRRRFGK